MHDDELKRQLGRMRTALEALGEETGDTRSRAADVAYYDAWGVMCGMEADASRKMACDPGRRGGGS